MRRKRGESNVCERAPRHIQAEIQRNPGVKRGEEGENQLLCKRSAERTGGNETQKQRDMEKEERGCASPAAEHGMNEQFTTGTLNCL